MRNGKTILRNGSVKGGINLRAYGQKNPLLEYKSEGFGMFKEMMNDMNAVTAQRIFRTQLQGMEQAPTITSGGVKNVKVEHQDTTGMGFVGNRKDNKMHLKRDRLLPVLPIKKLVEMRKYTFNLQAATRFRLNIKNFNNI